MEAFVHKSLMALKELGIDALGAEEGIIRSFRSMPDEVLESMEPKNLLGMMLSGIESGFYPGTGQAASELYAFDVEVSDVQLMYTGFLEGISRIAGGALEITDVKEEISEEDLESGMGTRTVRFCCNGKTYAYEAQNYYDWFDTGMLAFMNRVVEEQDTGRHLYVTDDGYQQCIVFYRTEEWAGKYRRMLGAELTQP